MCFPRVFLLLLAIILAGPAGQAAERITLYNYYDDPPLAVGEPGSETYRESLTVKLARWLTAKSAGAYEFVPIDMPRKRVDLLTERPDWQGVVAWANPAWTETGSAPKFLWSQPILEDASLVASRRDHPIEFDDFRSLRGLRFGGVVNFRYVDLEAAENSAPLNIVREDANNEAQNLLRLKNARVDFLFLPTISLLYHRRHDPGLDDWLYLARKPRARFKRYLYTNPDNKALIAFIDRALAGLPSDPEWQAFLQAIAW